jgi:hypothetical protein
MIVLILILVLALILVFFFTTCKLYDIHDEVKLIQYRLGKIYDHLFPGENGRTRPR